MRSIVSPEAAAQASPKSLPQSPLYPATSQGEDARMPRMYAGVSTQGEFDQAHGFARSRSNDTEEAARVEIGPAKEDPNDRRATG